MASTTHDPRGSVWRKWDLHVHTPNTQKNDNYRIKDKSKDDIWELFCDKIENSDVAVIGITDYFSVANYFKFLQIFQKKYPNSTKTFFPNIELCTSDVVNKAAEEVNTHLIFNPETTQEQITDFLKNLKTNKTDNNKRNIKALELKSITDFEEATTTRTFIEEAFKEAFGHKAKMLDYFIVVTAVNNDGARPPRGVKRKEIISDEIDKFSHAFFGGSQNTKYFLKTSRLESKNEIAPKPVLCGSDVHSFEDMDNWLGKEFYNQSGDKIKEILWIKSDPTFEGFKQILYEPEPGERVKIGPVKPDQKDDFKVISKIYFNNSKDFPHEIVFNKNLCSIIGSRSSGKSALLAYIAHAVNAEIAEELREGPGEGENYHWEKIKLDYQIEWFNGKTNDESPGDIVYIPQNYLFIKSDDYNEIKEKIKPVLFKVLPNFKIKYEQVKYNIEEYNRDILEQVDNWFEFSDSIKSLKGQIKNLGDKNAIEVEKERNEDKIKKVKDENKLSEEEINIYKTIMADISKLENRVAEINTELSQVSEVSDEVNFFSNLTINFSPTIENLPKALQDKIKISFEEIESEILKKVNKQVLDYKNSIEKEKTESEEKILTIKDNNKEIIEKYQKNIELEGLIQKLTEYGEILKKIDALENEIVKTEDKIKSCEKSIKMKIDQRKSIIEELDSDIKSADQSSLAGIKFGVEYDFGENLDKIINKINMRENTNFVEGGRLKINDIRKKPNMFLSALYFGQQKIKAGNDKKDVAKETLSLTEKILFTAEMEGDKIGGFSEPTMTPGKRALFLLRLVLEESEETWPLLVDQPEDDLDSRSIYDDIVPFLKKKKKERQIIMVSHNANLVIGADSEQVIIANRHGRDRENADKKQFNYLTGSLEFSQKKDKNCNDTLKSQGVREHACEILDGGKIAFEKRKNKYNI